MHEVIVKMPRMGVSVAEGIVAAWLKEPGQEIAVGEPLCEVSTDKVDTEIESTAAGTILAHAAKVGETVLVGAPLALVLSATADVDQGEAEPADELGDPAVAPVEVTQPVVDVPPAAVARAERAPAVVHASPYDHRAAVARLVNARRTASRWTQPEPTAAVQAAPAIEISRPVGGDIPLGYEGISHEVVETTAARRATAEHMIRSRQTAAHMTTEVEVDLSALTAVRERLNAELVGAGSPKLSYLPFIARATCAALREFPNLNSTFTPEHYLRWNEINIGIAVDTPRGLVVPVIRSCDALSLESIGARIADLAARARDRKLSAEDLEGGTFTISNPGSVGAVSAMAIINQPQVGILGVPAIVRRPWRVEGSNGSEGIAIRPILTLAVTFDHRAVDGAEATRFAVSIKSRLESWSEGLR